MPSGNGLPPIFVAGYPGDVGGANTECWHTAKLWRQFGLDVMFVPTWRATSAWRTRLDAIGCRTIESTPDGLKDAPGLPGSVVVSFCNANFLRAADRFRDLGCKIIWVNCMNWLFPEEQRHYRRRHSFDRYVFQSNYQREILEPQLRQYRYDPSQGHLIRGAFDVDEFPFRPLEHRSGKPFVIGRISRAAEDKFARNTWSIYQRIGHPIKARLMGWNRRIERKLGKPPAWAECLPVGAKTPQEFFSTLHCMVQINGGAAENWPRSGLEAMACGVPIVVQNQWGWREMIRNGETGFLCDTDDEVASRARQLADHEDLRLRIARQARAELESRLADPMPIVSGWNAILARIKRIGSV